MSEHLLGSAIRAMRVKSEAKRKQGCLWYLV